MVQAPHESSTFYRIDACPLRPAVVAAVIATRAASTTGASDAASVACPADQKRKAHP
jgi:hypothetical protein